MPFQFRINTVSQESSDILPAGYRMARTRFSSSFLQAFDEEVANATPGMGTLFFLVFIFPVGAVMLMLYSYKRHSLYNDLIQIAGDNNRLQVAQKSDCINAINHSIITIHDLANWPHDYLELLYNRRALQIINNDSTLINNARNELDRQISGLMEQVRILRELGQNDASVQNRISTARQARNNLKSMIETVRESNYSFAVIRRMLEGQSNNQSYNLAPLLTNLTNVSSNENIPIATATFYEQPSSSTDSTNASNENIPIAETTLNEPPSSQDVQVIHPSFLMDLLAHPATYYTSMALGLAGFLLLGLITVGAVPLTVASLLGSAAVLATGMGLFGGSMAITWLRNAESNEHYGHATMV